VVRFSKFVHDHEKLAITNMFGIVFEKSNVISSPIVIYSMALPNVMRLLKLPLNLKCNLLNFNLLIIFKVIIFVMTL
jgi:hypothetical protein